MSEENKNIVIWQAESTHPEIMLALREAMREVMDPELGLNIIQLGLVRDVIIEDGQAVINMILTTPFCPYGPAMLETTRQKAEDTISMPTRIELGMEMWDLAMMEEGAGADWGMW